MIDLRSDTVTRPTSGMREYMFKAEVGDDVFSEDPSINAFQQRMADLFGMEAGLFVPSGTMGNQLGLMVLTEPGDEVILDEHAHIFNYEAAAAGILSSIQLRTLPGKYGLITPNQVTPAIRNGQDWEPVSKVVAVEHTANKGGGTCYTMDTLKELKSICDQHNLYFHIDGARIWNATVATGQKPEELGRLADTLSICFSKGLGAPVGSMLLGSEALIKKARKMRKVLGGGMRQAGILAAAAEYAVDHHWKLMEDDHRRAKALSETIETCPALEIDLQRVESNIVLFDVKDRPVDQALSQLQEQGVRMVPFGPETIRATFHFEVGDDDLDRVIEVFKEVFG